MSALATALEEGQEAIARAFVARVRGTLAPSGISEPDLVDHVPLLIHDVAERLRAPHRHDGYLEEPDNAVEHGRQRLQLGFSLAAVVREYGLLHDCIHAYVAGTQAATDYEGLRILDNFISAASATCVACFAERRDLTRDEQRRRLLGLFEQAPGFVAFLRGEDLVFDIVNNAYLQLVGHRDIVGKPVRTALPEVQGQGFFELLDEVRKSGVPFVGKSMRISLQRAPGAAPQEAFVDFVYQPIRDERGNTLGVLAQGQDVTAANLADLKREEVEEALRASETRYRTLFEAIDDGFCLMQMIVDDTGKTVDYRFLEANAAFEVHTGLRQAVGKTALELVPGLDVAWFERYGRVAETGESIRFEQNAVAMGGRWFDVYANRVGPPELRQVALVFKDVTDRKRAEKEREELLERESAARREAEEASRLRDEFLATVSHELRTPLTSMLGWVQMLRTGLLPEQRREVAIETIERNVRAQAQLIDDLLDVSRILAGKMRLEVKAVEVADIVQQALDTARPAADGKGIQLHGALTTNVVVMADAHRLQQVVWNLLTNAIKFTPKGGVVQVLVERHGSSVVISVVDTGEGIEPAFLEHVFERFRQSEGGTTRRHGGLGLGLSIVKQLVEMHGGTVSAMSEGLGCGARFAVRLPVAPSMRKETLAPSPGYVHAATKADDLAGLDVLVVDDEHDTREMLRALLEGGGASVRTASSAREAFDELSRRVPSVLLSDVGMPGEDGYALIERVRAMSGEARDVPAVALTAYARSEDRTRALHAGFHTHVPKPVEPVELFAVIGSVARRHRR